MKDVVYGTLVFLAFAFILYFLIYSLPVEQFHDAPKLSPPLTGKPAG